MMIREASTPWSGMALVASPCTLPVSWGTTVGGMSLKLHCTSGQDAVLVPLVGAGGVSTYPAGGDRTPR